MSNDHSANKCPKCGEVLFEGKSYCPNCGLAVVSTAAERFAIDSYIQAKISQELATRLKDQNVLVREIGDKAEDVVWNRLKRYGWIVTAILVALGLLGIKSIDDAGIKVTETARQRIEPLVQGIEKRAQALDGKISMLESRLASEQVKVDDYQKQIGDYESRISKSGGSVLSDIANIRESLNQQQRDLTRLQGQVVDIGNRELRVGAVRTIGNGPSYTAYGRFGCPTVNDSLIKDGMLVAYCTEGSPPVLYQLTSTELRPVAGQSPAGFQDTSVVPKPNCNAANRGTFYVEKGMRSMADKPILCVKTADDKYDWFQLTSSTLR